MHYSAEVRFANKVPYPSDDNISASDVINKWYNILYINTLYIGIFMAIDFNVRGRRSVTYFWVCQFERQGSMTQKAQVVVCKFTPFHSGRSILITDLAAVCVEVSAMLR